jgi:hypothetical protein
LANTATITSAGHSGNETRFVSETRSRISRPPALLLSAYGVQGAGRDVFCSCAGCVQRTGRESGKYLGSCIEGVFFQFASSGRDRDNVQRGRWVAGRDVRVVCDYGTVTIIDSAAKP